MIGRSTSWWWLERRWILGLLVEWESGRSNAKKRTASSQLVGSSLE